MRLAKRLANLVVTSRTPSVVARFKVYFSRTSHPPLFMFREAEPFVSNGEPGAPAGNDVGSARKSEPEFQSVFDAHFRIIENIDEVRKAAATRGEIFVPSLPRDKSPNATAAEPDGDARGRERTQIVAGARGRTREGGSDKEAEQPPCKRATPLVSRGSHATPATRGWLRSLFARLQPSSRTSRENLASPEPLLNNDGRPQYPESEWENMLNGRAINLDIVVSSEHSVEIDVNISEKSHGDYIFAWDRAVAAYEYTFEHWQDELRDYTRHILQLFKSFPEELHGRVISYDKAVHLSVAARRDMPLTNFSEFSDLHLQWIQNSLQIGSQRNSDSRQCSGARREVSDATPATGRRAGTPALTATPADVGMPKSAPPAAASGALPRRATPSASKRPVLDRWRTRPRYARDLLWVVDASSRPSKVIAADATIFLDPLAEVPLNERQSEVALRIIRDHPHLFDVETPINIDRFEHLVIGHPYRALVDSVVRPLRQGAWLWADTSDLALATTWDGMNKPLSKPEDIAFACRQCEMEVELRRFSPPFGPGLLPGTLESFGAILRRVRRKYGRDATLVVCKSDVAQACRRILMHPLWYIRRTVFIKGYRYVDRDNGFGDCVAGAIWIAFFCLVIWITIY
ncbi:hypothetical protein GGF50DRAFT_121663, partial [Schizophyllum commune]